MDAEELTLEKIGSFLETMGGKGRSAGSLQSYRGILNGLYDYLPEGKLLTEHTGPAWKVWLEEQGLSPRTVNARLSALNSLYLYLGHRAWQINDFSRAESAAQPELSRAEYLRLLSAAKALDRERAYLLIKTLGGAGLRIQELSQLTVEAVRQGTVCLDYHNHSQKRVLRIPPALQKELMEYICRTNVAEGPVFVTSEGKPLSRSEIHRIVSSVSSTARVSKEKANPRCLWKMYQSTHESIQSGINLLIDQAYARMLDEEQLTVGWNIK